MTSREKNLMAMGISTGLCLLVAGLVLRLRDRAQPIEMIDDREEVYELLVERARGGAQSTPDPDEAAATTLVRETIPEAVARQFMPNLERKSERVVYDPQVYTRNRANLRFWSTVPEHSAGGFYVVTNSLGLREEAELAPTPPDLRVLVTGDSHAEGVVATSESFANVLEASLIALHPGRAIEVLNAAKGGYSFYHYLGVLEKYAYLEPDVFVVAVFGGNDFAGVLRLHRYFHRLIPPRPRGTPLKRIEKVRRGWDVGLFPQSFAQRNYFREHPEQTSIALQAAEAVTREIARQCERAGVALVFVYIPPFDDAQRRFLRGDIEELGAVFDMTAEDLETTNQLADAFLDFLEHHGISYLDSRPVFARSDAPAYWFLDHHLNVEGHRLIGEALVPLVERVMAGHADRDPTPAG